MFLFLIKAFLIGLRWNLNVVLIGISFMARDSEISSCVFWPFGILPLKKLCSVICAFLHWVIDFYVETPVAN
jgi:hypothetical protein